MVCRLNVVTLCRVFLTAVRLFNKSRKHVPTCLCGIIYSCIGGRPHIDGKLGIAKAYLVRQNKEIGRDDLIFSACLKFFGNGINVPLGIGVTGNKFFNIFFGKVNVLSTLVTLVCAVN